MLWEGMARASQCVPTDPCLIYIVTDPSLGPGHAQEEKGLKILLAKM